MKRLNLFALGLLLSLLAVPQAARAKLTIGNPANPTKELTGSTTARIAVTSVPGGQGGAGN